MPDALGTNSEETDAITEPVDFELDLAAFALVDDGPFVDVEGPAIVPCGAGGVVSEAGRVEVRTEWCDPADLATALPVDVAAGTLVDLTLSHDVLFADGGDVHLAIAVGDEVVWQHAAPLPQPAKFVHERIALSREHRAGERVVVHVHNHGANAYAIHGVRFVTP